MPFTSVRQTVRSVAQELLSRTILRNLLLLLTMCLLLFTFHKSSLSQNPHDHYLFYKFCYAGQSIGGACLDYNTNSSATASAEGQCINDADFSGPSVGLYEVAFGACPGYTVWNEAEVKGEFRDPGLDGTWSNTLLVAGVTLSSGWGADHCDGWRDQWTGSQNPCPPYP